MKEKKETGYFSRIRKKNKVFPYKGELELTYRCNLNCIHCYCKGSENAEKELTTQEWKAVLDSLQKEGCLKITFTGGDPLVRRDFFELYTYAKKKGFLVTILTNGLGFSDELIDHLAELPPYYIEITLNGISRKTYEAVTQTPNSFFKAIRIIKKLSEKKFSLKIKTNILQQNLKELARIKAFADQLINREGKKTRFTYDAFIYPRLTGDREPCKYRVSFDEMLHVSKNNPALWRELSKEVIKIGAISRKDKRLLYHCDSWKQRFYIDPYGKIKFCNFTGKFSADLKRTDFRKTFYGFSKKISKLYFKSASQCRDCRFRAGCYFCPVKAYLENGNEEGPVEYYCRWMEDLEKFRGRLAGYNESGFK